ncbi:hypothetical protein K491DRAFT_693412 [Lophiostoma macrostomum CBS 122681]|uniref:C2H2-type domain-containing protein n=1 Tax=Lophiostoma macrostomum CBS 122681 TaxID=1314788 RepID=A0A6A6T6M9_9PLEO|nr:hypothetical protein K491DRAFT_693412 [Lophiostoma macrostomum CBS 122681]
MPTPISGHLYRYGPASHSTPTAGLLNDPFSGTHSLQDSYPWSSTPGYMNGFEQPAAETGPQNFVAMANDMQYDGSAFLPDLLDTGALNGYLEGPHDLAAVVPALPQPFPALCDPPSAVPIPAQARPQRHQQDQAGDERLRCPKGCKSTFRRPAEFRRHMRKHETPQFQCLFNGCDKKFYRKDKAMAHSKVHETRFRNVLTGE